MGWDGVPVVAGVNDIWTAVLASRSSSVRGAFLRAALRRPLVRRAEAKLLRRADAITVQSSHDARVAIEELHLPAFRVHVLSNAAPEELFALPLDRPRTAVGWVGDARGDFYGSAARRLADETWARVRVRHADAVLHLCGPGTEALSDEDRRVRGRGFVKRIEDVYMPLSVLVAPVFKGHGRINKVVEAMAAGVPVVGDATAFHDLEGFQAGLHGVVADGWSGLAPAVSALLSEPGRRLEIAQAARALASTHFRWNDRLDVVERWLLEPETVGGVA
jgi:glycosyltransferase involved in cell wall biosynthesis